MKMTKKKVLCFSGIVTVILVILNQIGTFKLCGGVNYGNCMDDAYNILIIFLPFLPLFLFSLITSFLKEETFQIWWRFARIATPLSMFLIFLAPSYSYDFMFPIEKGTVAAGTSLLFAFISIIILFSSHWKIHEK